MQSGIAAQKNMSIGLTISKQKVILRSKPNNALIPEKN